jgi:hypothetical protein
MKTNVQNTTVVAATAKTDAEKANGILNSWSTGGSEVIGNESASIKGDKLSISHIKSNGCTSVGADGFTSGGGTYWDLMTGALHSKNFYISSNGDATFKGTLKSPVGEFGGFTLNTNSLTYGTLNTDDYFYLNPKDTSGALKLGKKFAVKTNGEMIASAGKIGNYNIDNYLYSDPHPIWKTKSTLFNGGLGFGDQETQT